MLRDYDLGPGDKTDLGTASDSTTITPRKLFLCSEPQLRPLPNGASGCRDMAQARGSVQCLACGHSAHPEPAHQSLASTPLLQTLVPFYPQDCVKDFARKLWGQMAHFCWLFQVSSGAQRLRTQSLRPFVSLSEAFKAECSTQRARQPRILGHDSESGGQAHEQQGGFSNLE